MEKQINSQHLFYETLTRLHKKNQIIRYITYTVKNYTISEQLFDIVGQFSFDSTKGICLTFYMNGKINSSTTNDSNTCLGEIKIKRTDNRAFNEMYQLMEDFISCSKEVIKEEFSDYEKYRDFIIKSRKNKNKRYEGEQK